MGRQLGNQPLRTRPSGADGSPAGPVRAYKEAEGLPPGCELREPSPSAQLGSRGVRGFKEKEAVDWVLENPGHWICCGMQEDRKRAGGRASWIRRKLKELGAQDRVRVVVDGSEIFLCGIRSDPEAESATVSPEGELTELES